MGITSKGQPFLDYNAFAEVLRMIDERDDVIATIWQGLLTQFEFEFIIYITRLPRKVLLKLQERLNGFMKIVKIE